MEITGIRIRLVDEAKLKAFASVVFDDCFMVNDLKVIRGKDGYFVSMPSRRRRNGRYRDVAHPVNTETREWIQEAIVKEYLRVLDGEESGQEIFLEDQESTEGRCSAPPSPSQPREKEVESQASLEEIQKRHLQDSFWSV